MNLKALNPRLGVLIVNAEETKRKLETWYRDVDAYKEILKILASPLPLKVTDVADIMEERISWTELLEDIGLRLTQ